MNRFLKLLIAVMVCCSFSYLQAQDISWMTGTWRGVSHTLLSKEIIIEAVDGSTFSGTKTNEVKDRSHSRVTVAITGYITEDNLFFKYGNVLYLKDPANGKWWTCTDCKPENTLSIHKDSLILSMKIAGCVPQCNGESRYYRLLCEYDSVTQVSLVNLWGTASDIAGFPACKEEVPPKEAAAKAAVAAEQKKQKQVNDSLAVVRKQQQQAEDSLNNAIAFAEKQRKQFVKDSVALVRKQQQQAEDSLNNAVALADKQRKQFVKDSVVLVRKQQQQAEDSLNNAVALADKQRKQFVKDSVALVRKQQQQAEDSLNNAVALADKQRKQHVKDSVALVRKQQQQAEDSLNNAVALADKQRKQFVKDSIALAKKIHQQAEDSLNNALAVAAQQRKQHVKDSIALVRAQQKRAEDSLKVIASIPRPSKPETPLTPAAKTSADTALKTRENVLLQTYTIKTPDILIEVFDNAQIDGDRVSIYHNDTLIVKNQMLQKEPIIYRVHATAANKMHEFIMIAENLGRIAPNTALMRITAGTQVFRLSVRTDLSTNAKIVFEYAGN